MERLIGDGRGKGHQARVLHSGALAVAPPEYGHFYEVSLGTTAPQNVLRPVPGKRLVINYIVISTDKDVGNDGAEIQIYEADTPTALAAAATHVILSVEVPKQVSVPLPGLNLLVGSGKYVNAVTTDDDCFVAVGFYLAEEDDELHEFNQAKGADAL